VTAERAERGFDRVGDGGDRVGHHREGEGEEENRSRPPNQGRPRCDRINCRHSNLLEPSLGRAAIPSSAGARRAGTRGPFEPEAAGRPERRPSRARMLDPRVTPGPSPPRVVGCAHRRGAPAPAKARWRVPPRPDEARRARPATGALHAERRTHQRVARACWPGADGSSVEAAGQPVGCAQGGWRGRAPTRAPRRAPRA
jgi:hypothetical protein